MANMTDKKCLHNGCNEPVWSLFTGRCKVHSSQITRAKRPIEKTSYRDIIDWYMSRAEEDNDGCLINHLGIPAGDIRVTIKGTIWRFTHLLCTENEIEIPKGTQVNHRCGECTCINPEHWYWGTHQQNIQDAVLHGDHGKAKLSFAQVERILDLYYADNIPVHELADRFCVSLEVIKGVISFRTYAHMYQTRQRLTQESIH